MNKEYDSNIALQTNVTLGDLWLEGLGKGASQNNLTVQFCMPYAHDVLKSASIEAVTNIRATDDYNHGVNQCAIGATSLLYHAIGKLPFKDGFYSSSEKESGGQNEVYFFSRTLMEYLSIYRFCSLTRLFSRSSLLFLSELNKPGTRVES